MRNRLSRMAPNGSLTAVFANVACAFMHHVSLCWSRSFSMLLSVPHLPKLPLHCERVQHDLSRIVLPLLQYAM
jgi:hypothetical protein